MTQPLDFQILPQPPVMVSLDGKDPSLLGDAEIYAAWPKPMPGIGRHVASGNDCNSLRTGKLPLKKED